MSAGRPEELERPSGAATLTGATPSVTGSELVEQLRSTLDRAGELVRVLEANLGAAVRGFGTGREPSELEGRVAAAETDIRELSARLVESEQHAGRLMNLYVATYQLYSALDPALVRSTIAEIAINLLGADQFVLLLRRDEAEGCEISLLEGMGEEVDPIYAAELYTGGDPMVDAALSDGVLRFGPTAASRALAVVPLRIQHEIVGVLVLLKLLDHKALLRPEDRDLLDLLSAHAGSALFAARLFAAKERKLRTLQSLVELARGQ